MANNLIKKGRTYYARLSVPKYARKVLGRWEFKKSLGTSNYRQALAKSGALIDHWQQQIEAAKEGNRQKVEALELKTALVQAEADRNVQEKNLILDIIADKALDIESKGIGRWKTKKADDGTIIGTEFDWDSVKAPAAVVRHNSTTREDAERFHELATGKRNTFEEHLETWLSELTVRDKTKDEYRKSFKELKETFDDVEEVTRRSASEFVRHTLAPGRAVDTVGKKLSAYQGFWKWLMRHGYLSDNLRNPWEGLKPKKTDKPRKIVRAFTEEEAAKLLELVTEKHKRFRDDLAICQIMSVTGVRLEEAASLKASDCSDDGKVVWLHIHDTKTRAGDRRVPLVVANVADQVRWRLEEREGSEYLFQYLKPNKYGLRSPSLTKRFNRTLRLFTKDEALAGSHSWRHRARTLLERGGISPWVSDWFMGHSRPGEGLDRYSQGPGDEQLVEAAEKIAFPKL